VRWTVFNGQQDRRGAPAALGRLVHDDACSTGSGMVRTLFLYFRDGGLRCRVNALALYHFFDAGLIRLINKPESRLMDEA